MRLLLIATHYWEKGGIEVYVKTLEQVCRDLKAEVDVLTVSNGWIFAGQPPLNKNGGGKLFFLRKVFFVGRLLFAALGRKYDAVLCTHPYLSPLTRLWQKWGGPPYLAFAYGIEVWNGLPESRRRGLAEAERVITISTYTAQRLREACGIAADKISLLAPCVPPAYLAPFPDDRARETMRVRWGLTGRKVILTVGRQALSENYKGTDLLIRALPGIQEQVGNVACIVAGGGDGIDGLKRLAVEMNLESVVQILGIVSAEDLLALYDVCDVFVLPSRGEGFGIVLLEAAARGRPSVGLNVGGVADAVCNGRTGLLVEDQSAASLGQEIVRVLEDKGPAHFRDADELRRIVVDNFGLDRFRGRLLNIMIAVFPSFASTVLQEEASDNNRGLADHRAEGNRTSSKHLS